MLELVWHDVCVFVCECVEQLTSAGSGYISRLPGTFCIGGRESGVKSNL